MNRLHSRLRRCVLPAIPIVTLMLQAAAQAPAVGSWSGVRILEPSMLSSSPPEVPVVACDPVGHTVAAWTSPSMGVAFSERYPGGEWSPATSVVPGLIGFAPQIAIGAGGVVALSWITPGQEAIPPKLVVSIRPVGGVFSTPTVLASGSYIFDSKLGVAENGFVTAIWAQTGVMRATTRNPGGTWTPVAVLSALGVNASLPDFVVNSAGAALAVWQETPIGGSGPAGIGTAYRPAPARSPFGAAQVLSGGALATWNPKAGISANGDVAVGYLAGNTMVVARKPAAGAWTAPMPVSPASDNVYYPALAMDAIGNIVAAWQKLDAGNYGAISKRVLPASGPWGAVSVLSSALDDASWPMVCVARGSSIATVTWVDNNTFAAHAAVGPLRGAWTIHDIGLGWWNTPIAVVAGSAAVAAVWPAPTANPNVTNMVANVYTP